MQPPEDKSAEGKESGVKIITTDDGSHSLFVPALNETYHSFHGAVRESRHVFIQMGLAFLARERKAVHIFEVGFGTGLNALLAAEFAERHQVYVHFTSIEAYPLKKSIIEQLNYQQFFTHPEAGEWFNKMHHSVWNEEVEISDYFTLKKIQSRLENYTPEQSAYDIIFFDAFAPNKQAELWDVSILEKIANAMRPASVFVTYCAKGQLKRDLQALGLQVETLPGPPGKKEMIRAIKR